MDRQEFSPTRYGVSRLRDKVSGRVIGYKYQCPSCLYEYRSTEHQAVNEEHDRHVCESKVTMSSEEYRLDSDPVNHPSHYTSDPSGIECIDVVRHRNFNVGNAIKYLWRAGLKGGDEKLVEDLRKAIWYIEDEIKKLERHSM